MKGNGMRQASTLTLVVAAAVVAVATSATEAAERVVVQAFAGEPYGVGKMTVWLSPEGKHQILRGQSLWLGDKEERALYPVISELKAAAMPGAPNVPAVALTAYFLFRGNGPLELTLDADDSFQGTVDPAVDEAAREALLKEWWHTRTW